jgi:glycosidase
MSVSERATNPSLYEINTRVWLHELGERLGRVATLDDVADEDLDGIAEWGFDWVWLLGVWATGPKSTEVARVHPDLQPVYRATLPDFRTEDVCGSCFAVAGYVVREDIGGAAGLARFRERLAARGVRLMLDFARNHMALDHVWGWEQPDLFVNGTEEDLAQAPGNWTRVATSAGERILAHGRDPYFAGWTDTLQLDYANPALRDAMTSELLAIAGQCDGVRCDMAMLLLPEVFERTWGRRPEPFWPAAIRRVREAVPGFTFMAEVYWDLEWEMQQQGFDYAYDKRLYDRLRECNVHSVRTHLLAEIDYQRGLTRFVENHDEPRAAATFGLGQHEAAAVVTYLAPGMRFFHQGQLEGKRVRLPVQLCRGPVEPVDARLAAFYERLLAVLRLRVVREGAWRPVQCTQAWERNPSHDAFVSYVWSGDDGNRLLIAINYAPHVSQCYARLPLPDLAGHSWRLRDLLGDAEYVRNGDDLTRRGLYLNVGPWACHVFDLTPA